MCWFDWHSCSSLKKKKGINSSSWICILFTCYFLLKTATAAQCQHETLILTTCFHSIWSYGPLFKPKRHEPSSLSLFLESRDSDSVQPIYWVRRRLWAGSSNLASAFTKTDASRPRGLFCMTAGCSCLLSSFAIQPQASDLVLHLLHPVGR